MECSRTHKVPVEDLSLEEQAEAAFAKILRCASARETSTARMREKLHHGGFSSMATNEAIDRAVSAGIIDDARYCDCLIRTALAQGKGLHLILSEARALNIEPEDLDAYQRFLEEDADSMVQRALELLRRHPPTSKNIQAASYRRLMAKGYGHAVAVEAANLYQEELATDAPSVQSV